MKKENENIKVEEVKKEDSEIQYRKEINNSYKNYFKDYDTRESRKLSGQLNQVLNKFEHYYNPYHQNMLMKEINISPRRPKKEELEKWLENPANNEEQLRNVSQFLNYVVMEYKKSIYYYANIIDLDYMLICENSHSIPDAKNPQDKLKKYKKDRSEAYDFLKKFKLKNQLLNVLIGVIENGSKHYYLNSSKDDILLQELPQNYCKLTSRHKNGDWAFQFNFNFFASYPESLSKFSPEFGIWFEDLLKAKKENLINSYYYPMPHEKSVCFKFDDNKIESIPVFSGLFPDALDIKDYKDLLKAKTELEAYQFIFFQVPQKDGEFKMDAQVVMSMARDINNQMPEGVVVSALPSNPTSVDLKGSQNKESKVGLGQQSYFETLGSPYKVLGGGADNATSIKKAIEADFLFMQTMYNQFERFINYQLSLLGSEFNFKIKFLRKNAFYRDEFQKQALVAVQNGVNPKFYMASLGFEPHEVESLIIDEEIDDLVSRMTPIKISYTMSGDEKGKEKNEDELSDKGIETKDLGTNEDVTNSN